MLKNTLFFIFLLTLVSGCNTRNCKKYDDGVVIYLKKVKDSDAKAVKVQVISDKIIRVVASPFKKFPESRSLITIENLSNPVKWIMERKGNEVIVKTSSVNAGISLTTGEVVFRDSTGQVVLSEKEGGGKTFTPVIIEGKQLYAIRQVFQSPDDEAFYGLGQHQNGQMNYKGEDVEMAQHNIIAVVPFMYSSKNYGILWDNYSITRFGDPREYEPLSSLQLFSEDGKPGGLTAKYYGDSTLLLTRSEDTIDYQYIQSYDRIPEGLPMRDVRKVTWEGSVSSDISGRHKFVLYASGYFKLWVDGRLIFDRWRQGWNPWYHKFDIDMAKGEKHTIKLYWDPQGIAYIALQHLDPLSEEEQNQLSLFSEAGNDIDYYFIYGSNADEVISGYRQVTGKAPIIPKWAMGLWQSRERYKTQQELLDVVREFRKRQIPLDNIVLDWQYWEPDKWGSHEFDSTRFPDPEGMVRTLHEKLHAEIMISVWPKFYPGTKNYNELNEKGYLYKRNIEKDTKDWIGYNSTFYDALNPDARDLYWKQINAGLNKIGIDAWWMDATEPDMESNNSIEERKLLMSPTALGPGSEFFNAYSLMNSKVIYEGLRKENPGKRVFILTRSAFAGQQRYAAATWSGDVASRWTDLGLQIPAGLNFCISGIPYWTHDIGGFAVERRYENTAGEDLREWRALMTRWFQFGAFCPLFRVHGQYPYREMYNVAPENSVEYKSMLYYDKLRYRLMPYIYTLAGKAYKDDYTIMRALVMDFAGDAAVLDIADEYMFGPSILVCPVYEYKAVSREAYLPASTGWYDFYSGRHLEGGQKIVVPAPLERIPLFIKEGSIIVFGPEMQYTGEKQEDPLTLYVYTGKDAHFELYEDEGVNYNYEKGQYSVIPFSYKEESHTLIIGKRQGSYPGMPEKRTIEIVWISKDRPVKYDSGMVCDQSVNYDGSEQTVIMKPKTR
jgi:alpha-D-xyloside xylohydrolase